MAFSPTSHFLLGQGWGKCHFGAFKGRNGEKSIFYIELVSVTYGPSDAALIGQHITYSMQCLPLDSRDDKDITTFCALLLPASKSH